MENELKHLLNIICHNKSNGCTWQGNYASYNVSFLSKLDRRTFFSIKDHLKMCAFEHLQCEYCSTSFNNRLLYEQHYHTCPKALVPCPLSKFGCNAQVYFVF